MMNNKNKIIIGAVLFIVLAVVVYFVFFHGKGGEAVNCVGDWEQDTLCPVDCGQAASTVNSTYKIVTPNANNGTACEFAEGATKVVDCPATDVCPIHCEGQWVEGVCPATCTGTTANDVYEVLVTENSTGNKCPFLNGTVREKECAADLSMCTDGNGACEGPNKQVCNDFMRSWVLRENNGIPAPWSFTTHTESGQYAMGFTECKPCERRGFIGTGSGYNVTIGNTTTVVNTLDEAMAMLELK